MLASVLANFEYEANTTAGNGKYFVNLLNILLKTSGEKLVKLQEVDLFLADFLSFESTVWGTTASRRDRRSWSLSAFYYVVSNSLFPSFQCAGDFHWRRPRQGPRAAPASTLPSATPQLTEVTNS